MASGSPDFVAVGGAESPALLAALAAARLGRSSGLVVNAPVAVDVDAGSIRISIVDTPRISSQHMPYTWLDTEILLAAPTADEVDPAMLGRFSRSLIGVTARPFLQNGTLSLTDGAVPSGIGALFLDESDLPQTNEAVPAPIALSLGPSGGLRLGLQGVWRAVGPARDVDQRLLAVLGAIFLARLTETRDPVTAARFAAAAAALLPPSADISADTLPSREDIAATE